MPDYAAQRSNMVASQVLANGVTEARLLDALGRVPREEFVPAAKRSVAYADAPLELAHRRWLQEPRTLAKLLELAEIMPTDKVLDVACTTGYTTAIIAGLSARVVGLEQDADFVRLADENLRQFGIGNATIVQGLLADGFPPAAPFDAILVNGAIETEPARLLTQLSDGGRLVAVRQDGAAGHAMLYLNEKGRVGHRIAFDASAPALREFRRSAAFVF